jgi:hypothetical protein
MIPSEEYRKEKLTINFVWANIFGILILIPITLAYGIPYFFLWSGGISSNNFTELFHTPSFQFGGSVMVVVYLFGGIVVHELIHGITWSLFTKQGYKSIKFGVMWKMLTPYCHCKEALQINHYILGAIIPAILLGLLPAIVAILTGHFGMLLFAIFFTMAACGDFLVINLLKKEKMTDLVQDHPSEAGCYIYRK